LGFLFGIFYAEYKEDVKHGRESKTRSFFDAMKSTKAFYIASFALGAVIVFVIVFVVYFSYHHPWTLAAKVAYNMISRKGYVIGFFMMCLPIMQGNLLSIGGWLGSDFFLPLSKVSFAAYIIHQFVIRYVYYNFRHAVYFDMSLLIFYATSFIVVVYLLSFLVTALFEAPFMHLRLLLEGNKKPRKPKDENLNVVVPGTRVLSQDSSDCVVIADGCLVSLLGVENLIIAKNSKNILLMISVSFFLLIPLIIRQKKEPHFGHHLSGLLLKCSLILRIAFMSTLLLLVLASEQQYLVFLSRMMSGKTLLN